MRKLFIAAAGVLALSTPAFAGTLEEVTKNGIVMSVQGMDIDVKYTPDGKFTALDGQITGEWKIKDDKLCTTSNLSPEENCTAYPKDKKSGDSFTLTTPQGEVSIKIK